MTIVLCHDLVYDGQSHAVAIGAFRSEERLTYARKNFGWYFAYRICNRDSYSVTLLTAPLLGF